MLHVTEKAGFKLERDHESHDFMAEIRL